MITLEEYKEHLIGYYKYEIDNSDIKIRERARTLLARYNDEYLGKIINDTYDFIKEILYSEEISNGFYNLDLDDDTTMFVSLNITGGGYADTLYVDPSGRIISRYILRQVFGESLEVDIKENIRELEEDNVISYLYDFKLYLQGFPSNMGEIKKQLFGETIKLINN
jgi:hypothetical protein